MARTSVIIPCFNTGDFIEECLESVARQGVPGVELIVVDDGSTQESTRQALRRAAVQYPGLQVIRTEHHNVGAARNSGFTRSSGEFVLFLDSDDLLGKDFLSATLEALAKRPDCGVAFTDIELFGLIRGVWRTGPLWSQGEIYIHNYLQHCSLIRREVFERFGGFNPNLWSKEDWDLWIKLHRHGVRFAKAAGGRALYRKHPNSKLSQNQINRPYLVNRVILNHKAAYGRLFLLPISEDEEERVQKLLQAWLGNKQHPEILKSLRRTRLCRQFTAYSVLYRALRKITSPMFESSK